MKKAAWDSFVKEIYGRYYPRMCEFACRIVGCAEIARDIAQDAFVVLLESQSRISNDPAAIKSYLYSSVKHAALNRVRHLHIASRIHASKPMEVVDEQGVLEAMVHAEIIGELYEAIESLPEKCASVCKMAYLEGRKNQEIADELGVSINTIKTQKQRAISLLRNKLSPISWALLLALL